MNDKKGNLYFFLVHKSQFEGNALTQFINFTKSYDKQWSRNFSFSDGTTTLHQQLTFKENLLLESVSQVLTKTVEENITEQIQNINNNKLYTLLQNYLKLDQQIKGFSDSDKQILSILKAIVKNSDHIFLNQPDTHLNLLQIQSIKSVIQGELEKGRNVYINSFQKEFWIDFVDYFIEEINYQFVTKSNLLLLKSA